MGDQSEAVKLPLHYVDTRFKWITYISEWELRENRAIA